MGHLFLSAEWVRAVTSLQGEFVNRVEPPTAPLRLNGTVNDAPFGDGPIEMHLDTSSGLGVVQHGHMATADVTITTDYRTAEALFVGGDPQAIMAAFLEGRIVVQGDLTKLVNAIGEASVSNSVRSEVASRVKDITDLHSES